MKNKKKKIIIVVLILIILSITSFVLYKVLNDENKLTVIERNWVNDNISTVQNVNVLNNVNVFGNSGKGVFYDFLEDFQKEYNLTVNPITYNLGTIPTGVSFGQKNDLNNDDILLYTDHYVMVGKNNELLNNIDGLTVGILSNDLNNISKYVKNNITFTQFSTKEELITAMDSELSYMIVPLIEYLDIILSKNYMVVNHFSDINIYYTMSVGEDTFSKVLRKYFNKWDGYKESFNKSLFQTFTSTMNLSETEIDAMQSISYNYGFVNSSPYEVITGGKYGGIVAVILSKFSDFADVDFNFVKYKNSSKFEQAIAKKDIDVYFNYYNYTDTYNQTSGIKIEYAILANRKNSTVINSIYSLIGKTVYVQENSKIYDYVKTINGLNIKTFSTMKDLFKLNKKDVYIVLDRNTFDYYSNKSLDNYTLRYSDYIKNEYNFKVKDNSSLYKLLNKYINILDEEQMILEGLENHHETVKTGSIITSVAEYIIYAVIIVIIILIIILKKGKKVIIAKKIKKDDKMRFIDLLTSLKNRNFLTENLESWNNNQIYPQTLMVIDLNKIQEINDLNGYNEGDKQIMAMANILVKTQLDNSEIMRTDGNEFVVYLVGYTQKQISNYIHKLAKEIKKLPYEYGAEIGYSMIVDDIKTIEDALNEAVENMKKQKGNNYEKVKK